MLPTNFLPGGGAPPVPVVPLDPPRPPAPPRAPPLPPEVPPRAAAPPLPAVAPALPPVPPRPTLPAEPPTPPSPAVPVVPPLPPLPPASVDPAVPAEPVVPATPLDAPPDPELPVVPPVPAAPPPVPVVPPLPSPPTVSAGTHEQKRAAIRVAAAAWTRRCGRHKRSTEAPLVSGLGPPTDPPTIRTVAARLGLSRNQPGGRFFASRARYASGHAARRHLTGGPREGAEGPGNRGPARLTEGSLSAETGACSSYPLPVSGTGRRAAPAAAASASSSSRAIPHPPQLFGDCESSLRFVTRDSFSNPAGVAVPE